MVLKMGMKGNGNAKRLSCTSVDFSESRAASHANFTEQIQKFVSLFIDVTRVRSKIKISF